MFSDEVGEPLDILNEFFISGNTAGSVVVENLQGIIASYLSNVHTASRVLKTLDFKTIGIDRPHAYRYISHIDNLREIFLKIGDSDKPFIETKMPDDISNFHEICLGHMRLRQFIYLICRNIEKSYEVRCTSQCLAYISHGIDIPGIDVEVPDIDVEVPDIDGHEVERIDPLHETLHAPGRDIEPDIVHASISVSEDVVLDTVLLNMPKRMMFSLLAVLCTRDATARIDRKNFPENLRRVSEETWTYIEPCTTVMTSVMDYPDSITDRENLRIHRATPIFMLYLDFKKAELKFKEQPVQAEDVASDNSFDDDDDSE